MLACLQLHDVSFSASTYLNIGLLENGQFSTAGDLPELVDRNAGVFTLYGKGDRNENEYRCCRQQRAIISDRMIVRSEVGCHSNNQRSTHLIAVVHADDLQITIVLNLIAIAGQSQRPSRPLDLRLGGAKCPAFQDGVRIIDHVMFLFRRLNGSGEVGSIDMLQGPTDWFTKFRLYRANFRP